MARMLTTGTAVSHQGVVPGSGERFAYLSTDTVPGGFVFEIADVMDACYPMMQMIADAASHWDGTNPIRELTL